jgi:hypothetical protein
MDASTLVYQTLQACKDRSPPSRLAARCGLPVAEVRQALSRLALEGKVTRKVDDRDGGVVEMFTAARRWE